MKYVPLKNQPNVSGTRLESISPSLRMDGRGFPCISWLDKGLNVNEVKYSFWDGLKWSFYDIPKVYISSEDIIFSPNALVLTATDSPIIAFARKIGAGFRLSLASYVGNWSFSNFDVDYEVGWIGVVKISPTLDSSSSSSNSSNIDLPSHFVATYDLTNGQFRVYMVNNASWSLLGALEANVDTLDSVRIVSCGRKMGIVHVYAQTLIKYNFFDLDSSVWSFPVEFQDLNYSLSYGDVLNADVGGYFDGTYSVLAFGWTSKTSTTSYVCSVLALDDGMGTEQPSNGVSAIVKSQTIDVSVASDYIVNGYRNIALCIDDSNLIRMIATGTVSDYFRLTTIGMAKFWLLDPLDFEGVSNGFVASSTRLDFSGDANLALSSDSGDIYFFEKGSGDTFPMSTPDIVAMNSKWAYHATYSNGLLNGDNIDGAYNNSVGDILRDAERPVMVAFNDSRYVDIILNANETYTLPSADETDGVEIAYTGVDTTTATVVLNGVSFKVKNVSGQFVWDSDNAHSNIHTFTYLLETWVQIAGTRSYTIVWNGTGSLIFAVQLKEVLGSSSSSTSSSFSRSLSTSSSSSVSNSSSSSSSYGGLPRIFRALRDEIFG